jgi:hypothetical protein
VKATNNALRINAVSDAMNVQKNLIAQKVVDVMVK